MMMETEEISETLSHNQPYIPTNARNRFTNCTKVLKFPTYKFGPESQTQRSKCKNTSNSTFCF